MGFLGKYKNIALFVAIVIVLFVGYSIFFSGESDPALSSQRVSPEESAVGRELLATLLTLRAIDLRDDLFANPTFKVLKDFSQPIPPQPIGRPNPFAPLGSTRR